MVFLFLFSVLKIEHDKVYSWGNGEFGRLGRSENFQVPIQVEDLKNKKILKMAAANTHNILVTGNLLLGIFPKFVEDNEVYTFGSSEFGKLGNGIIEKHTQETLFKLNFQDREIVLVCCAAVHTLVLVK